MAEHQRSTTVNAPANVLFDYLADIGNLPSYFDRMTSARPGQGEEIQVRAKLDGKEVDGKAWFRVDHNRQRIEWGSAGPNNYHGWLDVDGQGSQSRVTVHLSTERVANGEVDRGLEKTLNNIRMIVEGRGMPDPITQPEHGVQSPRLH